MPQSGQESRQVFYSGNVQGVGFRYTALRIARGLKVTGFVRNLADGRVELVAEGEPAELDRLLQQISFAMAGNIESVEARSESGSGRFGSFDIR